MRRAEEIASLIKPTEKGSSTLKTPTLSSGAQLSYSNKESTPLDQSVSNLHISNSYQVNNTFSNQQASATNTTSLTNVTYLENQQQANASNSQILCKKFALIINRVQNSCLSFIVSVKYFSQNEAVLDAILLCLDADEKVRFQYYLNVKILL